VSSLVSPLHFDRIYYLTKNLAEGLNGRLPNQDLINSFQRISRYTGGVPVVLYDHLEPGEFEGARPDLEIIPSWVPKVLKEQDIVQSYAYRAKNILRHVGYQARGRASGVHGLLHKKALFFVSNWLS
jgi:GPI-anchor transamidase subunit GAA1